MHGIPVDNYKSLLGKEFTVKNIIIENNDTWYKIKECGYNYNYHSTLIKPTKQREPNRSLSHLSFSFQSHNSPHLIQFQYT